MTRVISSTHQMKEMEKGKESIKELVLVLGDGDGDVPSL